MKIIKCKECGEQIPANVESCPNCGCPTKAKSKSKKIIIIFGMAILCIVAASLYFLMGKNKIIGNHEFANDSISKDSVTQLSDTEHTKVTVDPSCCAGVTPESHKAALETMKMCQIDIL